MPNTGRCCYFPLEFTGQETVRSGSLFDVWSLKLEKRFLILKLWLFLKLMFFVWKMVGVLRTLTVFLPLNSVLQITIYSLTHTTAIHCAVPLCCDTYCITRYKSTLISQNDRQLSDFSITVYNQIR